MRTFKALCTQMKNEFTEDTVITQQFAHKLTVAASEDLEPGNDPDKALSDRVQAISEELQIIPGQFHWPLILEVAKLHYEDGGAEDETDYLNKKMQAAILLYLFHFYSGMESNLRTLYDAATDELDFNEDEVLMVYFKAVIAVATGT